ncbi:LysR family transcriptional regulator [Pseudoduganella sp. FT25W]|jgi:DNA-binding transcriptional LysR family regulator|uniref:LysR family transcriptional regulator n=1 Tax=Duganella alba TaxID=2666081 RepID=A0A6L5QQM2_9BURK|nr:LysR family transcriptional regulator [Duganella alba]MRX11151.1 LysR family transcriptional regulator [Duganella alba]MRX19280.1 LysR family transcriptional regulator [Duganella alba]
MDSSNDRFTVVRLFLDAAQLGSFSAAGRKQGMSPAAASASIQRLEASLQVKLFERTTRQLRLTEEGKLYRHFSEQAMALMAEAESSLHAGTDSVRGMVKISAPSDLGRNVLMPMLDAFRTVHPDVQYALTLSDNTSNMVQDDIDLALRYGQLADSEMVARVLAPSRRVVCAAPSLIAQTGGPAMPEDLANLPTLVLVTALGPMQDWRYCSNDDADERLSVRVRRTQQSNDGEIIRKWAIAGQGYAYKSIIDISDDLRSGRLATVLDEYFTDSAPLNILYHRNRYQPPRIALLIAFLMQRFADLA